LDVISRKKKPGITTLKYFDAAILEAVALRPKPQARYQLEWDRAYSNWELSGRGFEPMPVLSEFKARFGT
jgi:hypothetical protein